MFSAKDLELKKIDHLGIVAGIVDSIGIVEIINNLLGSEPEEKVSAGQVVKAMILNGLSMMSLFQCFQSVHLVTFQQTTEFYNLTSEMKYILLFLPEACRNYYRYII